MRFWTAYAFIALGFATKALAAGGGHGEGHHSSITDLIAPAVNVAILLGVLAWKLKGPLAAYFNKQSDDIANTIERVNLKSKEAKMLLESEERKAANVANEVKAIHAQAENEVLAFEKNLSRETDERTQKLKSDANLKLQADKKAAMDELNAELLNEVIAKTKSTIKTNKDYQSKVSSKLLKGL
ncbi:ATP synthase F0 subunit B [Peredibacter starrii]|uniref:ATP synthase subunit b n=1 Tax=Peredibacter starrii TaxID=28202 RepID=A0AAX4HQ36_9BACT|nr:ATP synthase F0 subunit B [Peredibacter starrii]WPU65389.1 ATP synthase F0 subunit B [Peredibacter starrii]